MLREGNLNVLGGGSMGAEKQKEVMFPNSGSWRWTYRVPEIAGSLHVGRHHAWCDDSVCRIIDRLHVDFKREKSQRQRAQTFDEPCNVI